VAQSLGARKPDPGCQSPDSVELDAIEALVSTVVRAPVDTQASIAPTRYPPE
jgi:hypothetical protein